MTMRKYLRRLIPGIGFLMMASIVIDAEGQTLIVNGGGTVQNNGTTSNFTLGHVGFNTAGVANPSDSGTYRVINNGTTNFNRISPNDFDTGNLEVGEVGGGSGLVEVVSGSLNVASELFIDNGTMNVSALTGANATVTARGLLSLSVGGSSLVNVDGAGSVLQGYMDVGSRGSAIMNVINSGTYNAQGAVLGRFQGSSGTMNVSGLNSTVTNTGGMIVGLLGTGQLNITAGGDVSSPGLIGIGSGATGGSGGVLVDGAGSRLQAANLFVGEFGTGELNVVNDAQVIATSDIVIGAGFSATANANGTLLATGAGSSVSASRTFVGLAGVGALTVESGATFSGGIISAGSAPANAVVAGSDPGDGTIEVSGAGSLLSGSSLYLGGAEPGAGGLGAMTIGTGGTVSITGNGVIYAGGTLNLDGGEFNINGTLSGVAANVNLSSGTLSGSGNYSMGIEAGDGIVLAPGNSVGTLSFADLTINGGAAYEWEVENLSGAGTAGTDWDLIDISNSLTFNATEASPWLISIVDDGVITGFDASQSGSWTIAQFGSLVGPFDTDAVLFDTSGFSEDLLGGFFFASIDGNNLLANYAVAVPEPTSILLAMMSLSTVALRRSRRRAFDHVGDN